MVGHDCDPSGAFQLAEGHWPHGARPGKCTLGGVTTSENRLSPGMTLAFAALWLVLMASSMAGLVVGEPLTRLSDPAATAERVTDRDLSVAWSLAQESNDPSLVRRLFAGTWEETLAEAGEIHTEVALYVEEEEGTASAARSAAFAAVLLAEQERLDEALAFADPEPYLGFREGLRFVYADGALPRGAFETSLSVLEGSWPGDRLVERYARRVGADAAADAMASEALDRAGPWRKTAESLLTFNASLIAAGLIALLLVVTGVGGAASPLPAVPWTLADGIGVLIRGDVYGRLYYTFLMWLPAEWFWSPPGSLLYDWSTLFSSLPLAILVVWHLILPAAASQRGALGLAWKARAWTWPLVGLAAISIDLVGSTALGWASWAVGVYGDWSETVDETLMWGSTSEATLLGIDYIAWAPLFEELAFRGLLYGSLRRRLGPVHAALVSASIFSVVHFYSLPGFLATWWSGIVWAWAFERTHSLWPGIVAHGVYNALFTAGIVLLYR